MNKGFKFCEHCGEKLSIQTKFCPQCGYACDGTIQSGVGQSEDDCERTVLLEPVYPTLVRLSTGEKIQIKDAVFVIGRSRDKADYRVDVPAVSRRHLQLTKEGDRLFAEDMDSSNHTYVNGIRLTPGIEGRTLLKDGDLIRLAKEEFKVEIPTIPCVVPPSSSSEAVFDNKVNNTEEVYRAEPVASVEDSAQESEPLNENNAEMFQANINNYESNGVAGTNFFDLNEYVIDEKIRPFKVANAYKIHNLNGDLVGAVQQEISGGAKAARVAGRLLLGRSVKQLQKFNLNILDADGNVLVTLERQGRIGMAGYTVLISDASGNYLGKVAPKRSFKAVIFHVFDSNDNIIGIMNGKLLGMNFRIMNPDESEIGTISKNYRNIAREMFTTADKYVVAFTQNIDRFRKVLITAAAVSADMLLHEV